jgi:hypothetical protein
MQTSRIDQKSIGVLAAGKEMYYDGKLFGLRGVFRGQGLGIVKAVLSLTMFHEGRIWCQEFFRARNERLGLIPDH